MDDDVEDLKNTIDKEILENVLEMAEGNTFIGYNQPAEGVGSIRWNEEEQMYEYFDGAQWLSMTSTVPTNTTNTTGNIGLGPGRATDTLTINGTSGIYASSGILTTTGTDNIGIGYSSTDCYFGTNGVQGTAGQVLANNSDSDISWFAVAGNTRGLVDNNIHEKQEWNLEEDSNCTCGPNEGCSNCPK